MGFFYPLELIGYVQFVRKAKLLDTLINSKSLPFPSIQIAVLKERQNKSLESKGTTMYTQKAQKHL